MQKSKVKSQNAGEKVRHGEHCFRNFAFCILNFEFSKQIGFSLVEILISIAVIGILAVLALSGFSSFKASGELFRSADTALGTLSNARSQTLASRDSSQYGVFFDQNQNQIVLFTGGYYVLSAPGNEITKLPPQIEIASLSLTNGTTSITFSRLSGDPNATGTIVLRIKGNPLQTKTIQMNDSGIAEIK